MQLLCKRYASAMQGLCKCYVSGMQVLCKCYASTMQMLSDAMCNQYFKTSKIYKKSQKCEKKKQCLEAWAELRSRLKTISDCNFIGVAVVYTSKYVKNIFIDLKIRVQTI